MRVIGLDAAWSACFSVELIVMLFVVGGADSIGWPNTPPQLNHVLDGVHMGATWRIQLNDQCSAAMWTVANSTVITCC